MMESPEFYIVALNFCIVLVAYLSIYPKVAGTNFNKVACYDILISCFALWVVGISYWGSSMEFSLLFGSVNWFWFTFISYGLIEIPVCYWYCKKHNVKLP